MGLLPHEVTVELKTLTVKYGDEFHDLKNVKNIRDMVFILRELGYLRVAQLRIKLGEKRGYIEYQCENARIIVSDKQLFSNLFDVLSQI